MCFSFFFKNCRILLYLVRLIKLSSGSYVCLSFFLFEGLLKLHINFHKLLLNACFQTWSSYLDFGNDAGFCSKYLECFVILKWRTCPLSTVILLEFLTNEVLGKDLNFLFSSICNVFNDFSIFMELFIFCQMLTFIVILVWMLLLKFCLT